MKIEVIRINEVRASNYACLDLDCDVVNEYHLIDTIIEEIGLKNTIEHILSTHADGDILSIIGKEECLDYFNVTEEVK